jgi:hypothetical protein
VKLIRLLRDVAADNPERERFVNELVKALGGSWPAAQIEWNKAVGSFLQVPEVGRSMARAEAAAITVLATEIGLGPSPDQIADSVP